MSPEMAQARVTAARSLFHAGNFSGAERMLHQALAEDPECADAHLILSLALNRQGKSGAALQSANAALALSPNANGFRAKALALVQLNRKKEALEAAISAVADDPTDELARLALGVAYEEANKPREAEEAYRRAVEIAPDSPGIRADLGRFLLRRNRLVEAEKEAAQIDPSSDRETALLLRCQIALLRGRTEEAHEIALWILSRDATNADALRLLTQVKASRSPVLGLWWRFSTFMAVRPFWFRWLVMLPIFGVLMILAPGLVLLPIAYIWFGNVKFSRMLRQERKTVTLKKSF